MVAELVAEHGAHLILVEAVHERVPDDDAPRRAEPRGGSVRALPGVHLLDADGDVGEALTIGQLVRVPLQAGRRVDLRRDEVRRREREQRGQPDEDRRRPGSTTSP